MFISVWKIVAFFISTLLILHVKGETVGHLFTMLSDAFGSHDIMAWTQRVEVTDKITDVADILEIGDTVPVPGSVDTPIYVLLLQIFGAYFTYIFGKYLYFLYYIYTFNWIK